MTEQEIAKRQAEELERSRDYAVKRFGIKPEEFVWYNSGICYDRIIVNTEEAALKVAAAVQGRSVNGGWFDGMPLGQLSPPIDGKWDIKV